MVLSIIIQQPESTCITAITDFSSRIEGDIILEKFLIRSTSRPDEHAFTRVKQLTRGSALDTSTRFNFLETVTISLGPISDSHSLYRRDPGQVHLYVFTRTSGAQKIAPKPPLLLLVGMSDAAAFEKLVVTLSHGLITTHFNVAASCLFVYDFLLNFDLEYTHIWKSPRSLFKILFLVQRYLPFIDTVVFVQYYIAESTSHRPCIIIYNVATWSSICGIVLSEIVLAYRLWAVWYRNRPVITGLCIFFLLCWVPSLVLFGKFIAGIKYISNRGLLSHHKGCLFGPSNNFIFLFWVLMMVYDTGTFIMMLIPGIRAYRTGGLPKLLRAVYCEGVIYYAFISIVSVTNFVLVLTLSKDYVHLLAAFERVLHSILASRCILHIREIASPSDVHWDSKHDTDTRTEGFELSDVSGVRAHGFSLKYLGKDPDVADSGWSDLIHISIHSTDIHTIAPCHSTNKRTYLDVSCFFLPKSGVRKAVRSSQTNYPVTPPRCTLDRRHLAMAAISSVPCARRAHPRPALEIRRKAIRDSQFTGSVLNIRARLV
ncbi:hypothetical protein PM082_009855 [Marasmius tenuissimus]|nr:hypothetical protein PM082_009855 [Marasmius tenuissimus]